MPLMQIAKSLVMDPDSIVSTHTSSRDEANLAKFSLLSSLARWAKPRVQAKTEAVENSNIYMDYKLSHEQEYMLVLYEVRMT